LRWIVRNAAGLLPTGQLALEFLQSYGGGTNVVAMLPNVPDIAQIESQVDRLRRSGDRIGPADSASRPVVLFVGRLIPKKRAELLIHAFHDFHQSHDALLVLVGDGPLRPELERLADRLGLSGRVHFAGFAQPPDVLRWYARAKLFVLPSSETWGVAAVEALAAGLPVIVSDETGCYPDALADGGAGTVVPARDRGALGLAIRDGVLNGAPPEVVRQAWLPIRRQFGYAILAERLAEAIRTAVTARAVTETRGDD
jgi:glycosyltransferase involved in cell wall biosynthesis